MDKREVLTGLDPLFEGALDLLLRAAPLLRRVGVGRRRVVVQRVRQDDLQWRSTIHSRSGLRDN